MDLSAHYQLVAGALLSGRVVPFLGAGVNLVDRSAGELFSLGINLPSGGELAEYLAAEFSYPGVGTCPSAISTVVPALSQGVRAAADAQPRCLRPRPQLDLARVAQYGESLRGDAPLYDKLRTVLHAEVTPTCVHRFLARLPSPRLNPGTEGLLEGLLRHPLIVTTNYDDLLERQYEADYRLRDYDLVFYQPDRQGRSLFWHSKPGSDPVPVTDAANYAHPFFMECPTILKIHGTIRADPSLDAFVLTENDYVTYMADDTLEGLLPRRLLNKLQTNHLLFMGYSLQDWNLRVFLQRLKRARRSYRGWAIVRDENQADIIFWQKQEVDLIAINLSQYLEGLSVALDGLTAGV